MERKKRNHPMPNVPLTMESNITKTLSLYGEKAKYPMVQ